MAVGLLINILQVLPLVLRAVSETVEAVEAIGGPKSGAAKKQAVLEAVEAAMALGAAPGQVVPDDPDSPPKEQVRQLAGLLVEPALSLQKARRVQP